MKGLLKAILNGLLLALILLPATNVQADDFEKSVEDYTKRFPYQDTHNYAMKYTGGDASKFNTWVLGAEPALVKAGEGKVVRMNNDTYYKMAFFLLDQGPVTSHSAYETIFFDGKNKEMVGSNGTYTITTEEPPVDAFWSITAYDTERGGLTMWFDITCPKTSSEAASGECRKLFFRLNDVLMEFRIHGPLAPRLAKTWRPGEIEIVK